MTERGCSRRGRAGRNTEHTLAVQGTERWEPGLRSSQVGKAASEGTIHPSGKQEVSCQDGREGTEERHEA